MSPIKRGDRALIPVTVNAPTNEHDPSGSWWVEIDSCVGLTAVHEDVVVSIPDAVGEAVAVERERCARIAEAHDTGVEIAAAIRAAGAKPAPALEMQPSDLVQGDYYWIRLHGSDDFFMGRWVDLGFWIGSVYYDGGATVVAHVPRPDAEELAR